MGLETGTYISDLTITNPVGASDPKSQGDDHLRLIKKVIKNTFPNGDKPISQKGSDVASASALVPPSDGDYFDVTGTTAITSINTQGIGSIIRVHFDGILTLTHHATDLVLPGAANITTAAGDECLFIEYATGDWRCLSYTKASGFPIITATNAVESFVPRGLKLSNDTDADNDVNVTAGGVMDATNALALTLASEITKQIDAAWAVGDNAGGIDTGSVANDTVYAVWLIARSDTSVVDVLFSTSFTSPTMPTNYDYKRLIGFVETGGALNIRAFTHTGGDYFRYTTPVNDINDSSITDDTFETGTLSVPPNSMAHIYGVAANATANTATARVHIKTKGAGETAATANSWGYDISVGNAAGGVGGIGTVLVDVNKQVEYAAEEASGTVTVTISTIGCWMFSRNNP